MRVRELMQSDVTWIAASMSVTEAARILREHGVHGAPVGDAAGRIIGVISTTDLASGWELAEARRRLIYYRDSGGELASVTEDPVSAFAARQVDEVMMPLVFSVQIDDPLINAAALMEAEGIHRVIVLEGARLAGILSASDIVGAVARRELVPLH
jgi:CBS domain-containing protein